MNLKFRKIIGKLQHPFLMYFSQVFKSSGLFFLIRGFLIFKSSEKAKSMQHKSEGLINKFNKKPK